MYPCRLCPASAAALLIAWPVAFIGLIWIVSHFALYLSLFRFFALEIGIKSPAFILFYYYTIYSKSIQQCNLHKPS
nr:MAG TPA: hypothetical protein [Ackermannviridae sp.]